MAFAKFLSRRSYIWLSANLCGMTFYLRNASALRGSGMPGPGDGFYWLVFVAPLLIAFLGANLLVAVHLFRTRLRDPRLRLALFAGVTCLWISAFAFDVHHVTDETCSGACLKG